MDFPADFVGSKARNHRQSGDWQGFAMQSNGRTCRKDMRNILLIQAISIICSGVKIMVRIISGARRGKKLLAPQGEQVRPTTNMVKEALFNILFRYGIADSRFLDLFAGCGQIGLEALSRGAGQAVFVDSGRESVKMIEKNLQATGFESRAKVVAADFAGYLRGERGVFDIAFMDPPYEEGLLPKALELTARKMNPQGIIVCEHGSREIPPERAGEFVRQKTYKYGKSSLTTYTMGGNEA